MAKLSFLDDARKALSRMQPSSGQQNLVSGIGNFAGNVARGIGQTTGITDFLSGGAQALNQGVRSVVNTTAGLVSKDPQLLAQGRAQNALMNQGAARMFGSGLNTQGNFQYTGTGAPQVALSGLGALSGNLVPAGVVGGGLGGAFAALEKRPLGQAIGQGIGSGVQAAGVTKLLSPITSPFAQGTGGLFGQSLAKQAGARSGDVLAATRLGQVIGGGVGQGGVNVAEDYVGNKLAGKTQNTPGQNIASFLLGAGLGGHEAVKDLQIDPNGYLRNRAGRMFDPLSGKFVEASKSIAARQEQFVRSVTGNMVDFNGPTKWMKTERGLKQVPANAGFFDPTAFTKKKDAFSPTTSAYLSDLEKQQNAARSTVQSGVKQTVSNLYKEFKRKIVDSNAPIEDLLTGAEKKNKFQVLPSQDVRLQIDRVLRAPTLAGQFVKDSGLADVIRQAPDLHALDQYLIAKQASRVSEFGKETGRNLEKDASLVQELGPQYDQFAQKVTKYSQNLLDYAVQSGLVSQNTAQQLKQQYPDYVPLNRIFAEGELPSGPTGTKAVASLSNQSVVKKLEGSKRQIESPIASLVAKTATAFEQGEKNIAAKMLTSYKDLPGFEGVFTELKNGESAPHTISFLDNGVKKTFATTPEIEKAAKSLDKEQIGLIGKIVSAPTRLLRLGATGLNLGFTGANVVKDQITNAVISKKPLATSIANPNNFVRSLFAATTHNDLYDELVRNAAGGTSFDIGREASKPTVEGIRAGKNLGSRALYTVKNPGELLSAVENVIGRSEEVTRLQLYRGTKQALLKEGRTPRDAELLAAKAAREGTTNFARSGEWTKVLSWMIPYFNAGIQGSRTLVRNVKDRPAQTGLQLATTVFTPIAAATAWNLSDPTRKAAYEDVQDYEKENNIIIVPPNPQKDASGRWNVIKVPLPQGISNLGNLVRRPLEQANGLDPVKFKEIAGQLLQAGTSLDLANPRQLVSQTTPQFIKPAVETITNTNLFTGRQIVPEYQKNLPPEEQVSPYTSGTARAVGKLTNLSPRVIENAAGTIAGGVGRQVLNTSDRFLNKAGLIPEEQIGGQAVEASIANRFNSAAGGKQEDILDARTGQAQMFRKKALQLISEGKTDEAKSIAQKNGLVITKGDYKRFISEKKQKSVDLVIQGDLESAKKLARQYQIKITNTDVQNAAKRKAITFIKQGNKEEARKLRDKFHFVITQEDVN